MILNNKKLKFRSIKNLSPELPEDFPGGGGGGGGIPTNPPNPITPTGTTSTNGITSMIVKPSCDSDGFIKTFIGNSLCFDISGQIVNPEEPERLPNSTVIFTNMVRSGNDFLKSGGIQNAYDSQIQEPLLIDARQNCFVQFFVSSVQPPDGAETGFCGFFGLENSSTPFDRFAILTAQRNDHYIAQIYIPGSPNFVVVYDPGANGLELGTQLRIWMNGSQVLFQHKRSGNWVTFYTASLGSGKYKATWGTPNYNFPLKFPTIFKGGSTLPLDCSRVVAVSEDEGGVFSGEGCRRCWQAPLKNGDFPVSFSYPDIDPIECTIRVENLQIYSPDCSDEDVFVIVGETITVNHNGGSSAQLIVSGGIAIDAYTWILPVVPGQYSFKIISNGIETEICYLNVVRRLDVSGVIEGVYDNVAPGEIIEFEANCDDAVFTSLTHPELLDGNVFRADGGDEDTFGSFESIIKVEGCGQIGYFTIIVMPIYPIPLFCGPKPKMIPIGSPDLDVIRNVTPGKNAEWLINSKIPSITWKGLNYVGLPYILPDDETDPCKLNLSCIQPDKPTISGCPRRLMTAKRLDDFVSFVNREFGNFAYLDLRQSPPKLYKNVHFEKISDPTSSGNWKTSQRRSYDLIWFPCCDGSDNHSGSCVINDYQF